MSDTECGIQEMPAAPRKEENVGEIGLVRLSVLACYFWVSKKSNGNQDLNLCWMCAECMQD